MTQCMRYSDISDILGQLDQFHEMPLKTGALRRFVMVAIADKPADSPLRRTGSTVTWTNLGDRRWCLAPLFRRSMGLGVT